MIFILFFQYLGDHVPALGAFLMVLIVVSNLCLIFYKLGVRASNRRWVFNVEHMPAVIGQDIRERLERRALVAERKAEWVQDRLNTVLPLSSGVIDLVRQATGSEG